MTDPTPRLDRRRFLGMSLGTSVAAPIGLTAGASLLSGCSDGRADAADGTPPLPDGLDPADFEVHGTSPWTIEARRDRLRGLLTPTDRVFVRANLPFPDDAVLADREAWTVDVAGTAMTVRELESLGTQTVAAVLQCSGNGRRFFEHGPSGSPWGVGAAANVLWTGVPLRAVLDRAGVSARKFLTASGGEPIPAGLDRKQVGVERSIPFEKARADALLAWDMNGEPLTLAHGGPLRLVVPGYYGINQVKYVTRIAATADESDAKIQRTSYRVRPIGDQGDASQPSMWEMNVKSWIDRPLGAAKPAGPTLITGVAFSGGGPIESVEVTTDGGASWNAAELIGPDLGRFAWRTFAYRWEAPPGTHLLASRARDGSGAVQPELRAENERGYGHNGWRDHGISQEIA